MTRITTVTNQKGGVGKTTTALALATGLTYRGYNVLVVDTDPQGNISYSMAADINGKGLYEGMKEEATAKELIQHTNQGHILPSTLLLTAADLEFVQTGREQHVRNLLEQIKENYSHIIIDTPPTLGILTINALTASDDVIIPMGTDIYSMHGLTQLCTNINRVRRYCNPSIRIAGLLMTRYNKRPTLNREIKESIEEKAAELNTIVYKTIIREGITIKEAQTQQLNLFDYAPKSNPAIDYMDFITEYIEQEHEQEKQERRQK